jgi:hypothetical protein
MNTSRRRHWVERRPSLIVEAKRLVCTNPECRAEIIVVKKPSIEKQNLRCACGSDLKKIYHPPNVTIVGPVSNNLHILESKG